MVTNIIIELFLITWLFTDSTYQFFYTLSAGMILLPYLLSAAYFAKVAFKEPEAFKGHLSGPILWWRILGLSLIHILLIVLAVVVTLATAGVVWWMFRPKAGKVVICEKCGARYAVVQPPKYTNGWNYDKIAPASGRELPEGEPASDEGSQAPAPASAPSAANSKES